MATKSTVVIFALVRDKKILLEKRPVPGFSDHQYLIPGGAINKLEDLEDALKREIQEELGITPIEFKLLTNEDIPGLSGNILKPFIVTSWQGEIPEFILDKEDRFPLEWVEIEQAVKFLPIEPTRKITDILKKHLAKLASSLIAQNDKIE